MNNYYMKPGEEEGLRKAEQLSDSLSIALKGKRTPPHDAVIRKQRDKAVKYFRRQKGK